jgi:hypothetical protein
VEPGCGPSIRMHIACVGFYGPGVVLLDAWFFGVVQQGRQVVLVCVGSAAGVVHRDDL